jgi:phenylalanyl-tRNA synthetase beta chain
MTGVDLDGPAQRGILEKLGYEVGADWSVAQPSWRVDDPIKEKLAADIMRICGYGRIPLHSNARAAAALAPDEVRGFFAHDRRLIEHRSGGFGNLHSERLVSNAPNIKISNPLADFMNTARNSILPNMLDAVAANAKRGYQNLAMFEYGAVFDGPGPGMEHRQLVIARTGEAAPRHWQKRGREVDIFDVKADLLAFFGEDGAVTETDNPPMWAHPYRYGRLVRGGVALGEFGQIHPRLARSWRLKIPVVAAVADDPVRSVSHEIRISDFQPIERDFSFSLAADVPAGAVLAAARAADPLIIGVREFDFYENSIAFTITILPDRNLDDADLLAMQNRVIAAVESLGAKLRDR